jgi:hypothetical protein
MRTGTFLLKLLNFRLCLAGILLSAGCLGGWRPALAQSGFPDSPEFGYGARLDPLGQEVELAVNAASGIGLEWLGVDFDWARLWPDPNNAPEFQTLDRALTLAAARGLYVQLSIANPPAWAIGDRGPDIQKTAGLAMLLASRYAGQLSALELFPGANTVQGWGASPDPQAYTEMLFAVQTALAQSGSGILLNAGGLIPLHPGSAGGDMDDLQFLQDLYAAGAAPAMPIVSLRLSAIQGKAMAAPSPESRDVLRHYEEARLVMLTNDHADGLIWITGFAWPEEGYADPAAQALWISEAYLLMKAQLYLGVALFDRLNAPAEGRETSGQALISVQNGSPSLHPAVSAIGSIINSQNASANLSLQIVLTKKQIHALAKQTV